MRFRSWIVLLIIALNIAYAAAALFVFKETGEEPALLTGGWFAFTTGELWALAKIKASEHANGRSTPKSSAADNNDTDSGE